MKPCAALHRVSPDGIEFSSADPLLEPIPDPSKFVQREGESTRQATKRRNHELDMELAAVNCIALYILVMNFSQNGIDRLQDYMDVVEVDGELPTVSPGFDDG